MSFEAGAVKSIESNHSYLRRGSNVFDRTKIGAATSRLKWTGRKLEKGEKSYRLATQAEWPAWIRSIFRWIK